MDPYAYPGNQNNNRRKYKSVAPPRKCKSKALEWTIFLLFAFDVFCQFMAAWVAAGFWWIGLGVDVLVFMFILFLLVK